MLHTAVMADGDGGPVEQTAMQLKLLPMLLCSAAATNAAEVLAKLLKSTATAVNSADYDGRTALMLACAEGHVASIELLLVNGADVNARDRWGSTPLWEAVTHAREKVVQMLLPHKAELMLSRNRIAYHMCNLVTSKDNNALVRLLSLPDVDPNVADYDLRTPLHLAAEGDYPEAVKVLLDAGANPLAADRWGGTPTGNCTNRKIARMLAGEDVSIKGSKERSISKLSMSEVVTPLT